MQDPAPKNHNLLEDLDKPLPIAIISIDVAAFVAARSDVVDRTWEIDAELSACLRGEGREGSEGDTREPAEEQPYAATQR